MIAPVCAALSLALAVQAGHPARVPAKAAHAARRDPSPQQSALDRARAMLAQVRRDPAKRRLRSHWERAIAALERAAHGRDRAQGLLEASRARYTLYRFSQVDADRDAALRLALRARRAGARDAGRFAAAIRKEMGEEEPRRAARRTAVTLAPKGATATSANAKAAASPRPTATGAQTDAEDEPQAGAGSGSGGEDEPDDEAAPSTSTAKAASNADEPEAGRESPDAQASAPAALPSAPPRSPSDSSPATASGAASPETGPPGQGEPPARSRSTPGAATPSVPANADAEAGGDGEDASDDEALKQALADQPSPRTASEAAADRGPARVSELRSWSNKDYTRVAIYLSRMVKYDQQEIPADATHARRVALDLAPAALEHGLARAVGDSLVARVRAAQYDAHTVRVVLELPGRGAITTFGLDDPPRLIVDVGSREARREASAATAHPPDSEERRETPAAPPRPPGGEPREVIRRIIVDAGHGGHDSGAIGPTHVREKDVTLAIARRLAQSLRARGFEALLTRSDDRYLPLEERTAIANARHGDLFISVHANAHPRRTQRGVETYFLNVTDDRYARRLAARENGALSDEGGEELEVRRILSDLNAQSSAEASRRLAGLVQREVCSGIRGRVGDVRDLGVKSALFYVLLGARMPAVLIETSFISNRTEEKRLANPRFQEEVAASVARAVSAFAAQGAPVAAR